MNETKPWSSFIAIAYISLLSVTIVATLITGSGWTLIGGLVGTVVITKILVKGIF